MDKFRIVVSGDSRVDVFKMKPNATDTSDTKSWEFVGTYTSLASAFFRNSAFKPSDFKIAEDKFNPITLQNF